MILVTGATGFIGEQLVRRLLADGAPVRVLARRPEKVAAVFGPDLAGRLAVAAGDLGDPPSLAAAARGVERVYHAASLIAFKGDWARIHGVNVRGTADLMEACLAAGVRRVVHMSSIAAGGPVAAAASSGWRTAMGGSALRSRTEADPPAPLPDPYGRSKLAQEQTALSYGARGLEVVVVRPGAVFGPGDPAGINTLLRLVQKGRLPVYLGSPHTYINTVFVRDVVRGTILAMDRGRPGEIYNLVGANLTHAELFGLLARVSGGRAPRLTLPRPVLMGAARLVAAAAALLGKRPPMHPNDIRSWTANWLCSGEKARTELGLEPSDPLAAWAETLAWFAHAARVPSDTAGS